MCLQFHDNTLSRKVSKEHYGVLYLLMQVSKFQYFVVTKHWLHTKQVQVTYFENGLRKKKGLVKLMFRIGFVTRFR